MTGLVDIRDVSMRFGSVDALRTVNTNVEAGESVAVLGHNGAGKTTLFRIILGFLAPTGGRVVVDGAPAGDRRARAVTSYLPESVAFPKALTGREVVTLYARLKRADGKDVAAALERVGLADAADRRCGTYSKGMRQRLGLAQAIVGSPKLLLLDEPTSGLDPISRTGFYDLISEISATGTAVLLSSHGLSELEAKTDRVAILRDGSLVADAPLAELRRQAALPLRIRITATEGRVDELHARIGGQRVNGASIELACTQDDKMKNLSAVYALGDAVADVDVMQPSLDQIYRHFSVTGSKRDEAPK